MHGTISSIENHGSIIVVWLELEDGQTEPVYMDHRPFSWLLEGEGCEPDDLIGRTVYFDGESVNFLDMLEAA